MERSYAMRMQVIAGGIQKWRERLFQVPTGPRPWYSIILWWELRRIPYNLIMCVAGTVSVALVFFFFSLPPIDPRVQPGDDAIEPLAIIAFALLANVAYTWGWIAETVGRVIRPKEAASFGPRFFRLGLVFSLFLVTLPALAHAVIWLLRLFGHQFG